MLNNGIYEQMSADGTTSGRGHKTQRNGSGHGGEFITRSICLVE